MSMRNLSHMIIKTIRFLSDRLPTVTEYKPLVHNASIQPVIYYSTKRDKKKKVPSISNEILSDIIDIDEFKQRLETILTTLKRKFIVQITIQRSSGSLNEIQVEKDKKLVHLNEIAQINMKSPDLYVINMSYSPELIPRVEKALSLSGMNLGIQKESNVIYVTIPKITREYKENLAKSAKVLSQKSKEHIKEIQNLVVKQITLKDDSFSNDHIYNAKLKVQDLAKSYSTKIDEMVEAKKKELLIQL